MAESDQSSSTEQEVLYPKVTMYAPKTIRGLKKGETKLWCACGLSKTQPWCDGSHVGTGIKPLKWTIPEQQTLYQICMCKYSEKKPYCDGSHIHLPMNVLDRQAKCSQTDRHTQNCKLCTGCGWVPDF